MHTVQSGYSLTLEISEGQENALSQWLQQIGKDPDNNPKIPLSKCRSTLYCSIVTVPLQKTAKGKKLPAMLMFLSSISGPQKIHIQELVDHCGDGMREMLAFCKDVTPQKIASDKGLYQFLKSKQISDTFYTGMQYLTYDDIQNENELRTRLETYIDEQQRQGNPLFNRIKESNWATQLRKELIHYVTLQPELSWATQKWKPSAADLWANNIALWRALITIVIIGVVTIIASQLQIPFFDHLWSYFWKGTGALLALVIVLLILNDFRRHFVAGRPADERVRDINAHQLHPVINEITLAGPLRKGFIRRVAFYLIMQLAKMLKFALKIPTVVCARWIPLNNSQRLIFISNFSNTSEGYVRDFIDSKSRGKKINLIFGQGYGYPRTLLVILRGAIDNPGPFINDVYRNQHNTQFWYSPFKDLSVDNIKINRQIRLGLAGNMNENDAREWLKLF